jgi:hypothetical protein
MTENWSPAVTTPKRKLSASAMSTFLRSPRAYYYRYCMQVEPLMQSMGSFDHDKLAGSLWSAFVDRFYKGVSERENTEKMLQDWAFMSEGWVSPRMREKFNEMFSSWAMQYHQLFDPADGVRAAGDGSEKKVENDRFLGYLDGIDSTGKIVHECKSTSRSPQIAEQIWKVANSLQVKLYCVLTGAEGVCLEFAWKDTPYALYRCDVIPVTAAQRHSWEQELNALAERIWSLGDDPNNYPCHPDGCCITSKNFTSMCSFQALCAMGATEETLIGYKPRENTRIS